MNLQVDLNDQIRKAQESLIKDNTEKLKGMIKELEQGTDEIWRFHKERIWIPKLGNLHHRILEEAHKSSIQCILEVINVSRFKKEFLVDRNEKRYSSLRF